MLHFFRQPEYTRGVTSALQHYLLKILRTNYAANRYS